MSWTYRVLLACTLLCVCLRGATPGCGGGSPPKGVNPDPDAVPEPEPEPNPDPEPLEHAVDHPCTFLADVPLAAVRRGESGVRIPGDGSEGVAGGAGLRGTKTTAQGPRRNVPSVVTPWSGRVAPCTCRT